MSGSTDGNNDTPPQRPRGRVVIGTTRTVSPPPPIRREDSGSDTGSGSDEEVENWGLDLLGELGVSSGSSSGSGSSDTPKPMTRPRRGPAQRNIIIGLVNRDPGLLQTMKTSELGRTYKSLPEDDRAALFDKMTGVPDKLGKLIEDGGDIAPDLGNRLLARKDTALVSQVLNKMGGSSSGTATFARTVIAQAGEARGGVLRIAMQCAGDIVDEALDAGTAGRSNSGRTAFISQMGKSGPSKDSVDQVVGGTKDSLSGMKAPAGATLSVDKLTGLSKSEAGVVVQQTVKLAGAALMTLVKDLNAAAISPELSMITATVFTKARGRFNETEARRQAGGHIFLRVIVPAIVPGLIANATRDQQAILTLVTKALQSVANGVPFDFKEKEMALLNPWFDGVDTAVRAFIDKVVESGRVYCEMQALDGTLDPTDPRDVLYAARENGALAARLFADPDRDYPLGTRPAETTSPLGRLIEKAAHNRDRHYDFDAIEKNDEFARLVADERRTVLEGVEID